jgi:hypothetical protein
MAYTNVEGRQELLDALAEAIDEIGYALASLGAAYEELDEPTADRLEEELFGPVQVAYGRAKRTHGEFAGRHGLPGRAFEQQSPGLPSTRARGFIDHAVEAVAQASDMLAAAQDMPALLDVGDPELRAGLMEVRRQLAEVPHRARDLVRTLGR